MVNTPTSTPDDLPELQAEKEKLWHEQIKLDPSKKITSKQRENIANVLGLSKKEVKNILPNKSSPTVIKNVYSRMASTRSALFPFINVKNPAQSELETTGGNIKLENVFADPESKEAQAVRWLFNSVVPAGAKAKYEKLFSPISPQKAKELMAIIKMREQHEAFSNDESFYNIGEKGAATGKIPKLENKLAVVKAKIAAAKKKDKPKLLDEESRIEDEILDLEDKRNELKNYLVRFKKTADDNIKDNLFMDSSGFSSLLSSPNITNLEKNFDADSIEKSLSTSGNFEVAGTSHKLNSWIAGKSNEKNDAGRLLMEARKTKGGLVRSEFVLNELMKDHFDSSLTYANDQEKERFMAEMKGFLTTDNSQNNNTDANSVDASPSGAGTASSDASAANSNVSSSANSTSSKPWYGFRAWNPASYVTAPVAATGKGIWKNKRAIGSTAAGVAGAAIFGLTGPVALAAGGAIGLGMYYANKNKAS